MCTLLELHYFFFYQQQLLFSNTCPQLPYGVSFSLSWICLYNIFSGRVHTAFVHMWGSRNDVCLLTPCPNVEGEPPTFLLIRKQLHTLRVRMKHNKLFPPFCSGLLESEREEARSKMCMCVSELMCGVHARERERGKRKETFSSVSKMNVKLFFIFNYESNTTACLLGPTETEISM